MTSRTQSIHRMTCALPTHFMIFDALPRWLERFACEQVDSGALKRAMSLSAATNLHKKDN